MKNVPSRTPAIIRLHLPLLFAVLQSQVYLSNAANIQGITTTVTSGSPSGLTTVGFRQGSDSGQGQTSYYSGATSSSYSATTVDHSADSGLGFSVPTPGLGFPGATLSSVGTSDAQAGAGQQQQQQQFQQQPPQQQAVYQSADYGVPPALDLGSAVPVDSLSAVLRPGEYVPNCGCVARGACQREIGEYTRAVGGYSDVVCGLNFEICCFSGPCPGVLDEFVRAAPCVPQEQCLRPYGVLPTDVRDFGVIAPCPGQGAVRCISVNDGQLLEFQAAVAAIEASQARFTAAAAAVSEVEAEENVAPPAPQIIAPIVKKPVPVAVPIVRQPVPVAVPVAVTGQTSTVSTSSGAPNIDNALVSNIASFLESNGIGKGDIGDLVSASRPPVPGVAPAAISTPGFYSGCRSGGCYTPWAYRGGCAYGLGAGCGGVGGVAPGLGYGFPGVGFSKSFHFSKGFGVYGR